MALTENTSPTEPKYLELLVNRAFAEYRELSPFIKHTINKGRNEWGFNERTIITTDGSNWDYIPEDGIYVLNVNSAISID